TRRQRGELLLGRGNRHAFLHLRDQAAVTVTWAGVHDRHPYALPRAAPDDAEIEQLRHDADDGITIPLDQNVAPDHAFVSAEGLEPGFVAQHRDGRTARLGVGRTDVSPEQRLDPEHR